MATPDEYPYKDRELSCDGNRNTKTQQLLKQRFFTDRDRELAIIFVPGERFVDGVSVSCAYYDYTSYNGVITKFYRTIVLTDAAGPNNFSIEFKLSQRPSFLGELNFFIKICLYVFFWFF